MNKLFCNPKSAFIIAFLLGFYVLLTNSVKAQDLPELIRLSNKCFLLGDREDCLYAILKAEAIQIQAASIGEYSCQTRLLALQANLIIARDTTIRRRSSRKNLSQVKRFCKEL